MIKSLDKILITGSSGLLGCTLGPLLVSKGFNVVSHSFNKKSDISFDLTKINETSLRLDQINPTVIINLVAMTNVDECESNPNLAYQLNTKTVENLTNWISRKPNCHLIHLSSDQVYGGKGPHQENNIKLMNTYSLTKYAGELAATRVASTIIRTNFIGKSKSLLRESLSDWIINSIKKQKRIKVLTDLYFSPLSIKTLCNILIQIIEIKPTGVFNLGSKEGLSKADFCSNLANYLELSTEYIDRISYNEFDRFKAYRPRDMRMNCKKIENTLKITLPKLEDEIKLIANEYIK